MRRLLTLERVCSMHGWMTVVTVAMAATCAFAQAPVVSGGEPAIATSPPSDAGPRITVDEPLHDFGTVFAGAALPHTFKVTNTGKADLHITKINPGCGCTIAGDYPKVLKPGESGEIQFTLKTTGFRGVFRKSPTIYSDDPTTPQMRLTFKGEAKRYVDVMPPSVMFAALGGKEPMVRTVKITNNTETPLEVTMESPQSDVFKAELVETNPGKEYELRVTAAPPWGEPGFKQAKVILHTSVESDKQINIFVTGTLPVRLDVQPSVLRIARPPNQAKIYPPPQATQAANARARTVRRIVRFNNNSDTPIKIIEATVDDPAITVNYREFQQGKMCLIQLDMPVDYVPPEGGRKLTIKTDDTEKPVIEVPIIGQVVATPPPPATRPTPPVARKPRLRPAETMVGKDAPGFELKTESGKSISKEDLGGPVAVLDFFSPKCGFCRRQMPVVDKIRLDYEAKGVRFVYVAQTMRQPAVTKEEAAKMMEQIGVKGDLSLDPENKLGQLFKATSYPTMVIVDKSGKIAAVNVGARPDLSDRVPKQLDALLAGKPIPEDLLPPKNAEAPTPPAARKPRLSPVEVMVGNDAPEFELRTESGKSISSKDLGGPVAVLDFFSPKCGFCRRQMPVVDKVREDYEAKGVRFVYVAQTMRQPAVTKEEAAKMMEQIGVKGDLSLDPENALGKLFKASGYPTMVIVDKSGKIAAVNVGARPDLSDRVPKQLDALLAGKPIPADLLPAKPEEAKQ